MATAGDVVIKMAAVKENSKFNTIFKFLAQGEKVVTIDIMDVYNREVSKFSQRIFGIAAMLVEKLSATKLYKCHSLFKFPE